MRILFVVREFPLVSETFILNQITGLIERGHDVDIYAMHFGDISNVHPDVVRHSLLDRTNYYRMPANRLRRHLERLSLFSLASVRNPWLPLRSARILLYGLDARSLKEYLEIIPFLGKPAKYDIIHSHFGPNGKMTCLLRELGVLRGKLITSFHGHDLSSYLRKTRHDCYQRLFQKGDLFLPISNHWRERLIELGCDENRIVVHRMGVDCSKFTYKPRVLSKDDTVRLISIGRFVEKKGLEFAIRAVNQLVNVHPKVSYKIVGEGPLRDDLKALIMELNAQSYVQLLGSKTQTEVIRLLNQSHILVAPSVTGRNGDQEGIPVTLMEAMSMGMPVVSTKHSGIPELVQDGVSGFLVPERDVHALFDRLKYLIRHHNAWPKMGKIGRDHIESKYDIKKLNESLELMYVRLLLGNNNV